MIWVQFPAWAGNISLLHHVQTASGAHISSYPVVKMSSFLGVKWSGSEADHSIPFIAEVKKGVRLYIHSPIRLHSVLLSKVQR
jgi:hypothetical protein